MKLPYKNSLFINLFLFPIIIWAQNDFLNIKNEWIINYSFVNRGIIWIDIDKAGNIITGERATDGLYITKRSNDGLVLDTGHTINLSGYLRQIEKADTGFIGITEHMCFKVSFNCDILWQFKFSGFKQFTFTSMAQSKTSPNYIYLASIRKKETDSISNLWITKINDSGKIVLDTQFIEPGIMRNAQILINKTNDIFVVAQLDSIKDPLGGGAYRITQRCWVSKFNNDIKMLSKKYCKDRLGGQPLKINEDMSGNILVSGILAGDLWVLKMDTNCDSIWTFTFHGDENNPEMFFAKCSIDEFPNGDLLISGSGRTHSTGPYFDSYLVRVNQHGIKKWSACVPYESVFSLKCIDSCYFYVGGDALSSKLGKYCDLTVVKTDILPNKHFFNETSKPSLKYSKNIFYELNGRKIPVSTTGKIFTHNIIVHQNTSNVKLLNNFQ
jgi:hypothetical protein